LKLSERTQHEHYWKFENLQFYTYTFLCLLRLFDIFPKNDLTLVKINYKYFSLVGIEIFPWRAQWKILFIAQLAEESNF